MPTSGEKGRELFFQRDGRKQDLELHDEILKQGDDKKAAAVGRAMMQQLGLSDDDVDALIGKPADKELAYWVAYFKQHGTKAGHDVSDEPRNPHGEWTDGGGGDSSSSGASEAKPSSEHEREQSLNRIVASVPGAREKIEEAVKKLASAVATDRPISDGGFKTGKGVGWTPERQKVHAAIIEKVLTPEAVAKATPKKGEKPVVHLLGGAGGSGKGWFTKPEGTVKGDKALYLNSDDVKAMLPEYQGWNAAHLHEESSYLSKLIENMGRAAGLNMIIDGTMGNVKALEDRVKQYKAGGYRVEGHFMRVSPETSTKRALQRFVRGGPTGRFVPPHLLLAHSAVPNFEKARKGMDTWEMYDNEGDKPKFVARGTNILP